MQQGLIDFHTFACRKETSPRNSLQPISQHFVRPIHTWIYRYDLPELSTVGTFSQVSTRKKGVIPGQEHRSTMKVMSCTFHFLLSLLGFFSNNVTNAAIQAGKIPLYLMHFSEKRHGPLVISCVIEFATEICNNRSDILPGYELQMVNSLTKNEVSTSCAKFASLKLASNHPLSDVQHISFKCTGYQQLNCLNRDIHDLLICTMYTYFYL